MLLSFRYQEYLVKRWKFAVGWVFEQHRHIAASIRLENKKPVIRSAEYWSFHVIYEQQARDQVKACRTPCSSANWSIDARERRLFRLCRKQCRTVTVRKKICLQNLKQRYFITYCPFNVCVRSGRHAEKHIQWFEKFEYNTVSVGIIEENFECQWQLYRLIHLVL